MEAVRNRRKSSQVKVEKNSLKDWMLSEHLDVEEKKTHSHGSRKLRCGRDPEDGESA